MTPLMHWTDHSELVQLYDVECAGRWDYDYYLAVAQELAAGNGTAPLQVADVGCGTGVFAIDAAERGYQVVGVDPSATIIERAANRPGGDQVSWIVGTAADLPSDRFDLVVMMGHVAQYFLTDADFVDTLAQIARSLRPGGRVGFEVRDPRARAWKNWTEAATRTTYPHPDGGTFDSWVDVVEMTGDPDAPIETHAGHTVLPDGAELISHETLRFRTRAEVESALAQAGLVIERVHGDWDGTPVTDESPELIFTARKPR